jgi:hypothetical protein
MRIGICGVKQSDQAEFIDAFKKVWPSYKIDFGSSVLTFGDPDDVVKDQLKVLNARIDKAMEYNKTKNVVHLNTSLDSLVDIFWKASKDEAGFDDITIQRAIMLTKQCMSFYDVLLYFPLMAKGENDAKVEQKDVECDNFYSVILESYTKGRSWIFPFNEVGGSCPMIEIFGSIPEKIEQIKLYLTPDGEAYSEKDSLISEAIQ